ncbi:MAG: alpha/beta hydrolase [Burkholderiaceae bacterium]|jgi:pimeloyl-ACP methyl ester carboxylesterase|nr:alpha/beta hydrolase [Burkholderiaceae bacterium]
MSFTSHYLSCEGRELHFTQWGAGHAETVIAWHGLARTGRDMDDIAAHLAQRWRVICPDTIGRGLSQWSPAPADEYCLAFYVRLAQALLDQLGISRCLWLGTSMGGAIGLRAAATALRGRIRRLVLNDIGPSLAPEAVDRIRTYAGNPPAFATVSELERYFRTVYAPFGHLSEAQWRRLAETSVRRLSDGRVTPHYDPAMVQQFQHHPLDYEQWDAWDALDVPVLCLRGESSDLLLPETAEQMRNRGPRAVVVEIAGCGHAPALNVPAQYALVERFFAGA